MDKGQRERLQTEVETLYAINDELVSKKQKCRSAMILLKALDEEETTEFEKFAAEMQRLVEQSEAISRQILPYEQMLEVSIFFLTFYLILLMVACRKSWILALIRPDHLRYRWDRFCCCTLFGGKNQLDKLTH